jgi:hypothetical protein
VTLSPWGGVANPGEEAMAETVSTVASALARLIDLMANLLFTDRENGRGHLHEIS